MSFMYIKLIYFCQERNNFVNNFFCLEPFPIYIGSKILNNDLPFQRAVCPSDKRTLINRMAEEEKSGGKNQLGRYLLKNTCH